jgi:hypothetical protein
MPLRLLPGFPAALKLRSAGPVRPDAAASLARLKGLGGPGSGLPGRRTGLVKSGIERPDLHRRHHALPTIRLANPVNPQVAALL